MMPKPIPQDVLDRARQLRAEGKTETEIAKLLKVTTVTLLRRLGPSESLPGRRPTPRSESLLKAIRDRYRAGQRWSEIKSDLRISPRLLSQALRGEPPRRLKRVSEAKRQIVRRLRKRGVSIGAAGRAVGISRDTAKRWSGGRTISHQHLTDEQAWKALSRHLTGESWQIVGDGLGVHESTVRDRCRPLWGYRCLSQRVRPSDTLYEWSPALLDAMLSATGTLLQGPGLPVRDVRGEFDRLAFRVTLEAIRLAQESEDYDGRLDRCYDFVRRTACDRNRGSLTVVLTCWEVLRRQPSLRTEAAARCLLELAGRSPFGRKDSLHRSAQACLLWSVEVLGRERLTAICQEILEPGSFRSDSPRASAG